MRGNSERPQDKETMRRRKAKKKAAQKRYPGREIGWKDGKLVFLHGTGAGDHVPGFESVKSPSLDDRREAAKKAKGQSPGDRGLGVNRGYSMARRAKLRARGWLN